MSEGLNPFVPNATFLYPPEKGYIENELVNESLPLGTLLLLELSALLSARKVSKYGVFLVRIFPPLDSIQLFSPNTGKYRPEKSPYLDTFHVVCCCKEYLDKVISEFL